jgi:hypothetical protein
MLWGHSSTGMEGSNPARGLFFQILSSDCRSLDILILCRVGRSRSLARFLCWIFYLKVALVLIFVSACSPIPSVGKLIMDGMIVWQTVHQYTFLFNQLYRTSKLDREKMFGLGAIISYVERKLLVRIYKTRITEEAMMRTDDEMGENQLVFITTPVHSF